MFLSSLFLSLVSCHTDSVVSDSNPQNKKRQPLQEEISQQENSEPEEKRASPKPSAEWTQQSIAEERKELRRLMRPGTRTMVYESLKNTKQPQQSLCSDCDIILVTICSLRKDYVGIYKKRRSVTPNIDRIAKGGFFFKQAYASSNFTLGGLSSILTGRFGITSGVTDYEKGLPKDIYTLPQVLSFYGFQTAAFTIEAGSGFRPEHGLDRGFLRMELTEAPRNTPDGRWLDSAEPVNLEGDGASAKPVGDWLARQPISNPIFAMFHTRTAHYPFVISTDGIEEDKTGVTQALWDVGRMSMPSSTDHRARSGFGKGDSTSGGAKDPLQARVEDIGQPAVDVIHQHYRDSVKRMDKDIGVLIEAQRQRGRLDKTLWVLVADHGESLYEHEEFLHGGTFYEPVINIPMIFNIPNIKGKKSPIPALVSHVDILPTILDIVGVQAPHDIDGRSMLPLLRGEKESIRKVTLASGGAAPPKGEMPGAVIAPPWTLLLHEGGCDDVENRRLLRTPNTNSRCLYNLKTHPKQNHVLTEEHPEKVTELNNIWKYFMQKKYKKGTKVELDKSFVEELRRSGYDFR